MSNRDSGVVSWEHLLERLRERFLRPEGEMKIVNRWRTLQQYGTVASYADYVFRLKALCEMGDPAEFKLAFSGLQPELQAEIRKHLRIHRVSTLSLEQLFSIAADAEVGLVGKSGKRELSGSKGIRGKSERMFNTMEEEKRKTKEAREEGDAGKGNARNNGQKKEGKNKKNEWHGFNSVSTTENGWKTDGTWSTSDYNSGTNKRGKAWVRHYANKGRESSDWKGTGGYKPRVCYICDKEGYGWITCPSKQTGAGCLRCGSAAHRLIHCPQRPTESVKNSWDIEGKEEDEDQLACMMETKVMEIKGAPMGTRLLYYPIQVRKTQTKALLDSGASVNCIDEAVVKQVGGCYLGKPKGVLYYPDKRRANVRGIAQLEVRGPGYKEMVSFWVVRGLGVPVLLGTPWLRA